MGNTLTFCLLQPCSALPAKETPRVSFLRHPAWLGFQRHLRGQMLPCYQRAFSFHKVIRKPKCKRRVWSCCSQAADRTGDCRRNLGNCATSVSKDFIFKIYFLRMWKGGRKRERETLMCERNINWLPLDLAHKPGICPDQESNQRPFNSQAGAQSTEPH